MARGSHTSPALRAASVMPLARWPSSLTKATQAILRALLPWLFLVAIWEVGADAGHVNVTLFPPPSHFIRYVVENDFQFGIGHQAASVWVSILASFLRVLVGLAIGFVSALAFGILISVLRPVRSSVMPILQGLAPIAPIAWIPLGIVLFGVGNETAIFVVFVGVFFVLTIATTVAVDGVDPKLIKSARTLGANGHQIWTTVVLPAVLPQVFTLLRINFFAAWMAVLAAEMVGLKNGLGAIIIMGREMFNTDLILVGMCLIGGCGYAADSLLLFVQRSVLWWQRPNL